MYLMTFPRPDIVFVDFQLLQSMDKPTHSLWTFSKRLLQYICETSTSVFVYSEFGTLPFGPVGYSDSDLVGCKVDRKSTSGYVFCLARDLYPGSLKADSSDDLYCWSWVHDFRKHYTGVCLAKPKLKICPWCSYAIDKDQCRQPRIYQDGEAWYQWRSYKNLM